MITVIKEVVYIPRINSSNTEVSKMLKIFTKRHISLLIRFKDEIVNQIQPNFKRRANRTRSAKTIKSRKEMHLILKYMVDSSDGTTRKSYREETSILLKVKETILNHRVFKTSNLQTATLIGHQTCLCNKVPKIAHLIWHKYLLDQISSCKAPRLDTQCLNNNWNRTISLHRCSTMTHWVLLRMEAAVARLAERMRMNWINE